MKTSKIVIRGEKQVISNATSTNNLEHESSFLIKGNTRGISEAYPVTLTEDSVIEFVFEDNTTWYCSSNTIDEIFPEVTEQLRSVGQGFEIPLVLKSFDTDRSLIGNVLLKVVNIFKRKVTLGVRELAGTLEKRQLENQIGLFRLDADFQFQKPAGGSISDPYLLFIHGTASSTRGSFGDLAGTDAWKFIRKTYGSHVLAFQHESLTKSPLDNLVDLVTALPKKCTLHIITQSRGGLVGELLSRFSDANENQTGFTETEIGLLRKSKRWGDVDAIEKLKALVAGKQIKIEKFIRVACPTGGTTLASKRVDHLLNMIFNLIGVATGIGANPIYGAFKNLISACIDTKNDVDLLPGLEAMNPNSPFVEILNSPGSSIEIDNSLIIISGNCKMKLNFKALLIIASKLFYRQDNDLVVDTASMYSGTRRTGLVQYYIDEGTDVDHFNYFRNEQTVKALLSALRTLNGEMIPEFQVLDRSLAERTRGMLLGLDGGQVFRDKVSGAKPILVILPGIMGSNLAQKEKLIWINYARFLAGELKRLDIKSIGVGAPSLVKTGYGKIVSHFSTDYDVVTFPYDWRQQLAGRANLFNQKVKDLMKYNQPIKVIGHSMGGVLVRDFIIYHNDTWTALNKTKDFKLIFLGAPLGGSFRIPAVLFGQDDLINKLSKIDIVHTKADLLKIFSKLPGLLSLLPHSKEADFSQSETWEKMGAATGVEDWPIPSGKDLTEFGDYRDAIVKKDEDIDYTNIRYVAGHFKETPCGYRIDETGTGTELVFLSTSEGDQSVTWETGIPKKMIASNTVYYTDVVHGALANEPKLFAGLADLLRRGETSLLSKTRPALRGEQRIFRSTLAQDFDLSPEGVENTILGITESDIREQRAAPVRAFVVKGDLKFATYPVLAGHFTSDAILYAEKAIDKHLNFGLSRSNALGLYPGKIGTNEVFSGTSDFPGAIIVGLGDPGSLTLWELFQTVEKGISKYLLSINSSSSGRSSSHSANGISSLVIGCGYGGLTVENSVRAIVQGVVRSNNRIKTLYGEQAQVIEYIEFIEQYGDRALTCFYALSKMETEFEFDIPLVIEKKKILIKPGSKERLPGDSAEEWWTRINVKLKDVQAVKGSGVTTGEPRVIQNFSFMVSTGGAREEMRELHSSKDIIDRLVRDVSTNHQWTPELAKTIFELLIPNDFKERLKKQSNISWIVDKDTAAYPWELLQDQATHAKPLCINAGMIRQLATRDYNLRINPVNNNKALVIADPDLKGFVNQLPGALAEGQSVVTMLKNNGFDTANSLMRGSSVEIIQRLFSDEYKIIHLAGHGFFDANSPEGSGMVIGNNVFLSSREITQMSSVPELVVINCCFLGKTDGVAEAYYRDRYRIAANLGVQLIENGVKAVIAAGWEVNDEAALKFTEAFYKSMFSGDSFGDAVQQSRIEVYNKYGSTNTWGAYQCYGDPFYRLTNIDDQKGKAFFNFVIPEQALIELGNLSSEIEMGGGTTTDFQATLTAISEAIDRAAIRSGAITEREALIHADLYEYNLSLEKFKGLRDMENASYSVASMEDYCLIRCKHCALTFSQEVASVAGLSNGKPAKSVEDKVKRLRRRKVKEFNIIIKDAQVLLDLGPTAERYLLMGNIHRQMAMFRDNSTAKIKDYSQAAYYYQKAYRIKNSFYRAYGLIYWLEIESALISTGKHQWGKPVKTAAGMYELPSSLKSAMQELESFKVQSINNLADQTDYWNVFTTVATDLCTSLLKPEQFIAGGDLLQAYVKAWSKTGSPGKKRAEIEHLKIISDLLSLSRKPALKALKKKMTDLADGLEKLME